MKRLAVFAHFDKKNIIDDYVLFYINELKKYCENILFLTLSDLSDNEKNKLENVICVNHNEYDFGSYKRGFEYAKEKGLLVGIEELIFVNDSVYCIGSLEKIFGKKYNSDFWGVIENKYGFKKLWRLCISVYQPHLQSWFMAFDKKVFNSDEFINFLNSIKEQPDKNSVILNYEIGLTQLLKNAGFKYEAYVSDYKNSYNPSVYYWRELVQNSLPFVKRSVLLGLNRDKTTIYGFEDIIKNKKVLEMIKKNTGNVKINNFIPFKFKLGMFEILRTSPDIIRRILTKILKTFCPFMFD